MGEQALEIESNLRRQVESALDKSELPFQGLLEKLPVGAYTCDPEGLITYFNPRAVELWGRAPKLNDPVDRFCGSFKLFSSQGLPIDHDQCWVALALKMNQEYNGQEIIIERPDGTRLTVLAYANPIRDETSKLLGAVNILVDISERKRAELQERLLTEVSHLLATSLDYEVALLNLTQLVVPRLADWCVIDLIEEDGVGSPLIGHVDQAKIEMAQAWRRRFPVDWNSSKGAAKVVQTGQPELYPEVTKAMLKTSTGDLEFLTLLRQLEFSSIMIVPLVAHGQTFGTMTFIWGESRRHYNEADLALAEELAHRAATVLDNVRIYEAERTARAEAEIAQQRLTLLAKAGEALIASPDYKMTLANLTHIIVPSLADWCVVDVIGDDGLIHRLAVVHKDPAKAHLAGQLQQDYPAIDPQGNHTIARMMRQGEFWFDPQMSEVRLAAEARDESHLALLQGLGFASEMVVPLQARGRTLGAITFVRSNPEQGYDPADMSLAEELVRRAALAIDNARLYKAEQEARAEAEAAQQRLALLAEMRERNRLAQELHDTVAQALGYLNLKIGMTYTSLMSDQIETVKANLLELKQVIGETYTDVREEIFNLRAKVQAGMNFMEVLNRYIEKYRRFYNLNIQLIQEVDPALFEFPAEVTSQLIRAIQEALINVRKHARVNTAVIRLSQENGQLCIRIEDQGQGFDLSCLQEKTASFGLQIMRERVESVGSSLELETAPGQGTRVTLRYKP